LARRYVPLTLAHMIGKASLELDWVHHATEKSEEIRVFATLFPEVSANAGGLFMYTRVRLT
jgi:C-22 sterol desaturase